MRYFLKGDDIYAYDEEQVAQGYAEGLQEITEKEVKDRQEVSIDQLRETKTVELNTWYKNIADDFKVNIKDLGVIDGGYKAIIRIQAIIDTADDLAIRAYPLVNGKMAKINGAEDLKKIKRAIQVATTSLSTLKMTYEAKIAKAKNKSDLDKIVFTDTIEGTL